MIPYGGPILYVIFGEAILFRLTHGDRLEETIEMREVATNSIIGFGAEGCDVERPASLSNMTIVTAKSGALLVEVDTEQARQLDMQLSSDVYRSDTLTNRLKSKIERAVFHSDEALVSQASLDSIDRLKAKTKTCRRIQFHLICLKRSTQISCQL